jgi:peroxiredoxin
MPEVAQRSNSWLALLLAVGALAANFAFFLNPPLPAALPWLSLLLAIAAFVVLVIGLRRALLRWQIYRGKVSSIVLAVLILMFAGASLFIFYHARALPNSTAAPQVGQQPPDFTLADTAGRFVSLDDLLTSSADDPSSPAPKAVLLIFYRGYWWPFCNLELRGVEKRLAEFKAAGVRPVAISVDPPAVSLELSKTAGYTFTILSDPDATVTRRYHLLHLGGGPDGQDIARPAEFLIDRRKVVRWANFAEDVRVRARANQMLAAASQLR